MSYLHFLDSQGTSQGWQKSDKELRVPHHADNSASTISAGRRHPPQRTRRRYLGRARRGGRCVCPHDRRLHAGGNGPGARRLVDRDSRDFRKQVDELDGDFAFTRAGGQGIRAGKARAGWALCAVLRVALVWKAWTWSSVGGDSRIGVTVSA